MRIISQIRSIFVKAEATEPTPAPTPLVATETTERRARKRTDFRGLRVLIIDDSPTVLAVFAKIFKSAGCMVLGAADAEQGISIAQAERPDLIFLDIVLPRMNGFAALRYLRKTPTTKLIPTIMMSGNEQATEEFYAKKIGADDFLAKPCSRAHIFNSLEALVSSSRLKKSLACPTGITNHQPQSPVQCNQPTTQQPANNESRQLLARSKLAAMGLRYFDQQEYHAALHRKDSLAVKLFIEGGGIDPKVGKQLL